MRHYRTLSFTGAQDMEIVIQFSAREEAKALPILLRQTPGVVLPNRTYVLCDAAVQAIRAAGVDFRHGTEIPTVSKRRQPHAKKHLGPRERGPRTTVRMATPTIQQE